MYRLPYIPAPSAERAARARRCAAGIAFAVALAGVVTPIGWAMAPLMIARAWQGRARPWTIVALLGWLIAGARWIDLGALSSYPPTLTGPWSTLLIGAVAASAAWGIAARRSRRDVARVAAMVALVAAPWSPLQGVILVLSCWLAALRSPRLLAANDNASGADRCAPFPHTRPSYAPLRLARSSTND